MNANAIRLGRTGGALGAIAALLLAAGCPAPKVEPLPAAPKVLAFTATPGELEAAGRATLSWETADGQAVKIFDAATGAQLEGVDDRAAGTLEVPVERSALFVLRVTNSRGVADSAAVEVRLAQSPNVSLFQAVPGSIPSGGAATLAWAVSGARSVKISDPTGATVLSGQTSFGTIEVRPEVDSTYTLDADGARAQVTVKVAPELEAAEVSPGYALPGGTVTLSWASAGATRLTLEAVNRGVLLTETDLAKVKSGSFEDAIPQTARVGEVYTYRLELGGPGGATQAHTLSVYVSDQAALETVAVPRYGLEGGSFTLSWTTVAADVVELAAGGTVFYRTPNAATAASGSLELPTPASATEYTITARNHRGTSDSRTHTVEPVGATQLTSFTASPATIANGGDPVTLTWATPNARRLTIVANGEYTVVSRSGVAAEGGSVVVYPNEGTTYELRADNLIGVEVTDSQPVAVTTPAELTPSIVGPLPQGAQLTLTYAVGGGAPLHGFAHDAVNARPASTGFIDIAATGNKLPFSDTDDDRVLSFTPELETWLYGERLAGKVNVSTNGFLVIGPSAVSRAANKPLPDPTIEKNFYAPYWADLELAAGSGIYWEVKGEAPERVLIVQWDKLRVSGESSSLVTFQAQLHQTGRVAFEYQTLDAASSGAVVGLQGPREGLGLTSGAAVGAGVGLDIFGPVGSPVTALPVPGVQMVGWVKLNDAYLKLRFTPHFMMPGDIVVTEAMFSPAASIAATGEWLEITNRSSGPYDLDGWALDFGGGSVHTLDAANGTTLIPPGGVLVLGQSADPADNDGVAVGYVYGTGFAMDDTAGSVTLTRGGAAVSTLSWSSGAPGTSMTNDPGPVLLATDSPGTAPHPLSCAGTQPFGAQSPQQLGSPGVVSGCFPYALTNIPGAYEDIRATGTQLLTSASDYSGYGEVTLPAPFTYFGTTYTSINLSMVGFATFGPPLTSSYNTTNNALPSSAVPNGVLAPFWDEIVRNTGSYGDGKLLMERRSGYTIIAWDDFRIYAQFDTHVQLQLKLFDSGVIEFHYGAMTASASSGTDRITGSSATTWLEAPDGLSALVVNLNNAGGIQANTGYRFTP